MINVRCRLGYYYNSLNVVITPDFSLYFIVFVRQKTKRLETGIKLEEFILQNHFLIDSFHFSDGGKTLS